MKKEMIIIAFIIIGAMLISGCNAPAPGNNSNPASAGNGTLKFTVTDLHGNPLSGVGIFIVKGAGITMEYYMLRDSSPQPIRSVIAIGTTDNQGNAIFYVNGILKPPVSKLSLEGGIYSIMMSKDGYKGANETIKVTSGKDTIIAPKLDTTTIGTLITTIYCGISNNQARMDNAVITVKSGGTVIDTKTTNANGTAVFHLNQGSYYFDVSKNGYESKNTTKQLIAGHFYDFSFIGWSSCI